MNKQLLLAGVIALGLPTGAMADDMPMENVPQAVLDAANKAAEGRTLTAVSMEMENGTAIYEFAVEREDGRAMEIDIFEDGSLDEIELEVAMEDLPESVRAKIEADLPGFVPTLIEKSTRPSGIFYEFEGPSADGSGDVDVEIAEDGSEIVVKSDAAE